ncbi:hypothetical protein TNCV_3156901 [Trichonephila clavipes]|nr:hypothetical protein TNCV_3156901 [Trichonephila clavipes]
MARKGHSNYPTSGKITLQMRVAGINIHGRTDLHIIRNGNLNAQRTRTLGRTDITPPRVRDHDQSAN